MTDSVFMQAFVYLAAAVIAVPVARRLGLGSALGYLLGGVLVGPYVLGLVGKEGQDVMHFAEFGVVLMLFLVGLELEPRVLWRMRRSVLGLGGSQVILTSLVIGVIAFAFGLEWQTALAVGMTLSLSSTAIVLQTLGEKGWLKTQAGKSGFSTLLFQDVAVIPILAILPFLALPELGTSVAEPAANAETAMATEELIDRCGFRRVWSWAWWSALCWQAATWPGRSSTGSREPGPRKCSSPLLCCW